MTDTVLTRPSWPAKPATPPRPAYRCSECGHQLRVHGPGRRRIFFEIGAEEPNEPVMDRACPQSEHPLPGKAGEGDQS